MRINALKALRNAKSPSFLMSFSVVPAGIEPATQGFSVFVSVLKTQSVGIKALILLKPPSCAPTMRHMNKEPKIVATSNLKSRAYITFYHQGQRYREYNGNRLNLPLHPNRADNIAERDKLLSHLQYEFKKALNNGWNPEDAVYDEKSRSTAEILQEIVNDKCSGSLSWSYKRDLISIHSKLMAFLTEGEKQGRLSKITSQRLNIFLSQFDSTGTHYMGKRRNLGVLFSNAVDRGYITLNPVLKTQKKKTKATLHKIYTKDQVKRILDHLQDRSPKLHLCCLLVYGCFLRPHEECRLLKRYHFNSDFTRITLSGDENKSGRIRTVPVPEYVREVIMKQAIDSLEPTHNIFSKTNIPYNVSYFNIQWQRVVAKKDLDLIEKDQTIYSFRHTAAVGVYRKSKDIHILQQLLGHSNMIVTLRYLRGLGELHLEDQKQYMPEL